MTYNCSYPKNLSICFLFLIFITIRLAAQNDAHKTTFASQDLFRSAAFLQNNHIVEDYKDQKILYYANHDNVNTFFTEKGVVYKVSKVELTEKSNREHKAKIRGNESYEEIRKQLRLKDADEEEGIPIKTSVVNMQWVGSNPNVSIETGEKQPGYYTYLKADGSTFKTLITDGYKTIIYKNLYPGIDVEYSFPEKGGMEYNLVVKPGADVKKVKMVWSGIEKIKRDATGNILIQTSSGDILEHAPVSFSGNGEEVASAFSVKGNDVQFNFPNGYNSSQTLTVDPWVTVLTTLTPSNLGLDVDYDFQDNLFVYGAGPSDVSVVTDFFKIEKFDVSGNPQWTFNGVVGTTWNTADSVFYNYPGNLVVDKVTGKVYVSQGFNFYGTRIIRLTTAGVYDNFVSAQDTLLQESWGFAYNCSNGSVLALGGGTTSSNNMEAINTITGATTISNITGRTTASYQDVIKGTYDTAGNLYVLMNSGLYSLPYTNTIYKVNSTFNGNVWSANSNFTSFTEAFNAPYWNTGSNSSSGNSNWSNALAANGSYLYYYDGHNLAAYMLANGAPAGTPYVIAGYDTLRQGGIAVDDCNHVYVGGVGVIKTFSFSGTGFTPGADIPLGVGFSTDTIHDVKYNASNNLLYVTGARVVGTYIATLSTTCNVTISCTGTVTSLETVSSGGNLLQLSNRPNPLGSSSIVSYTLPENGPVDIRLFSLEGKEIEALVAEKQTDGKHEFNLNATHLASGMYILKMVASGNSAFIRIVKQ